MTKEELNKLVITRAITEVLNAGRFEVVDELFTDDLLEHDPHQRNAVTPKQAFIAAVKGFHSAFPDGRMQIEAQIAEGDLVSTRWSMVGTHQGEFMGVAASNRTVSMTGIFFDRLKDGKIIETWANYDLYGLMQQITSD